MEDKLQVPLWYEAVFCNQLILKKILQYLSVTDIKYLRETSTQINNEILSTSRFKKGVLFVICEKLKVLQTTDVEWKNIRIELYQGIGKYKEERDKIMHLLKNHVEDLTLAGNPEERGGFLDDSLNEKNLKETWPLIMNSWEQNTRFEQLKSLRIHSYLLNAVRISNTPLLTDTFFENLKRLSLFVNPDMKLYNPKHETENLVYLSKNCKSLTEFSLDRAFESHLDASQSVKDTINNILKINAKNLTVLNLDDDVFWRVAEAAGGLTFPSLKHCKIRVSSTIDPQSPTISNVVQFLRNQPLLESLSVTFVDVLPFAVLNIVRERSKNLNKLHIKSMHLDEDITIDFYKTWDFLKDLEELREFNVIIPKSDRMLNPIMVYPLAMTILPSNVSKINLRGLHCGLERFTFPVFSYPSLTELSLMRCKNSLIDEDLQLIIANMSQLVKLEFSHCHDVTTFGVTGVRDASKSPKEGATNPAGVSIDQLRGLKILTMRDCGFIIHDIAHVLKFQFLTELDVGNNTRIDNKKEEEEFIEVVISQNPLLEKLCFSHVVGCPLHDNVILLSNGRCKLTYADYSWPEYDSDIDAEIDNSDSDFSGGGYHLHDHDDDLDFDSFEEEGSEDGYDVY